MAKVINKCRLYLFMAVDDYQKYGSLIRSFHIKKVKVLRYVPCNCLVWEDPAEVVQGGLGYRAEGM